MTTIVWDGRFLAADTLAVFGPTGGETRCLDEYSKLELVPFGDNRRYSTHRAFAINGPLAFLKPWVNWFEARATMMTVSPPLGAADAGCVFITVSPGLCEIATGDIPYLVRSDRRDAWGSGAQIALGALGMGASAMEAVAVCIERQVHTGGVIEYIDTHAEPWVIDRWAPGSWIEALPFRRREFPVAFHNHKVIMAAPLPEKYWEERKKAGPLGDAVQEEIIQRDHGLPKAEQRWPDMTDHLRENLLKAEQRWGGDATAAAQAFLDRAAASLTPEERDAALNKIDPLKNLVIMNNPGEQVHIVVRKPYGPWRLPECAGQLAYGTGCGRCLRCNREYWMIKSDARRCGDVQEDGSFVVEAPSLPSMDIHELIRQWNIASAHEDNQRAVEIESLFRLATFPEGMELVLIAPTEDKHYWHRELRKAADASTESE